MGDIVPSPINTRIISVGCCGTVIIGLAVSKVVPSIVIRIGGAQLPTPAKALGNSGDQAMISSPAQVAQDADIVEIGIELIQQAIVSQVSGKTIGVK